VVEVKLLLREQRLVAHLAVAHEQEVVQQQALLIDVIGERRHRAG
jgi:hypothetical protein